MWLIVFIVVNWSYHNDNDDVVSVHCLLQDF